MQVRVRHQPSFAVARLGPAPGEPVQVESGAMTATSHGVTVRSRARSGIMKGLGRAFPGGESFFISACTAPRNGGWVDVAAGTRGSSHGVQPQTRNPSALISRIPSPVPSR